MRCWKMFLKKKKKKIIAFGFPAKNVKWMLRVSENRIFLVVLKLNLYLRQRDSAGGLSYTIILLDSVHCFKSFLLLSLLSWYHQSIFYKHFLFDDLSHISAFQKVYYHQYYNFDFAKHVKRNSLCSLKQ